MTRDSSRATDIPRYDAGSHGSASQMRAHDRDENKLAREAKAKRETEAGYKTAINQAGLTVELVKLAEKSRNGADYVSLFEKIALVSTSEFALELIEKEVAHAAAVRCNRENSSAPDYIAIPARMSTINNAVSNFRQGLLGHFAKQHIANLQPVASVSAAENAALNAALQEGEEK